MQQEGSGAMEKNAFTGQSPVQFKSNNISGEKKSDFAPHKNGRNRRHGPTNGNRNTDLSQSPRPFSTAPKGSKSYSDKRSRQRGSYDYRQREEVVESEEYDVIPSTGSRKGNANHLLNFKFKPRETESFGRWGRGHNTDNVRSRGVYRKLPRYNKEQFLQASCQFVVRDRGEYAEQAVNPDALVSWDMIELIKTFSTEPVTCPICLQEPFAGKITKCGHIYCWACFLHYLHLGDNNYRKCPICYEAVTAEDLKSVQLINVPDFSVGDEIEMKLMRKNKGNVYVMPKSQWEDRKGQPMNIQDGSSTKFMKLLVASLEQIQREVIDAERIALAAHLSGAEESETAFIQMAQTLLDKREASLKKVFKRKAKRNVPCIPGLVLTPTPSDTSSDEEEDEVGEKQPAAAVETVAITPVLHISKPSKVYANAFDDAVQTKMEDISVLPESEDAASPPISENVALGDTGLLGARAGDRNDRQRNESESSLPFGSPPSPFPLVLDQAVPTTALSLEETAETLELPMYSPLMSAQPRRSHPEGPKDAYFFYQASTGQHIYLHSLNAHCLTREYGSLENSPETIKATILAIQRCFMTEEVRKRLRYLNHIPLTCEFYVMELKFAPPLVSKDTLKSFHAEFEKKRKARHRTQKDEKMRAKKFEIEHKKSFGIYPEVQIPLSNMKQFPSHLATSGFAASQSQPLMQEDSSGLDMVDRSSWLQSASEVTSEEGLQQIAVYQGASSLSPSSLCVDNSGSDTMSFAQMLKAGKSVPQSNVWGRGAVRTRTVSGGSSSGSREIGDGSDGEDLPAPSFNASMSDAIEQALNSMEIRRQTTGSEPSASATTPGGKKKKRKEKQLLFSTAMARKN